MSTPPEIVVATANPGKLTELTRALRGVAVTLQPLSRFPGVGLPEETGATFAENARLKALAAAQGTGLPALADDSGLVVPALDGAPGVFSARFAGPNASDPDNIRALLARLPDDADRSAWFACSLCLAHPDGRILWEGQGVCYGVIAKAPRGDRGFGYDPVFFSPPARRTFGELSPEEKDRVSHRGAALKALRDALLAGLPALEETS